MINYIFITLIGGKDNVISAAHCATRLRIVLKDDKKVNIKEIEEVDLVKGSFNNGGQFQIILGTGIVDEVYKYFISLCDISEMSKEQLKEVSAKKANVLQRFLKALADVFVPILLALVAAALAVFFIMRKNAKMKSIASASGISALLGITEPAVFGVNLKLKYPFVGALIGSAVGSAYATFMKVLSLSQGPAGLPGAIVIRPESMVQYMVTMVITFVTATIATILLSTVFQKKENSTN